MLIITFPLSSYPVIKAGKESANLSTAV